MQPAEKIHEQMRNSDFGRMARFVKNNRKMKSVIVDGKQY
jgi:hypothetical protein